MKAKALRRFRPGMNSLQVFAGFASLLAASQVIYAADEPQKSGKSFKLEEVSVFANSRSDFVRGQQAECRTEPFREVKAYPTFVSSKPIYGSLRCAADYQTPNSGIVFYFALDESKGAGKGYDRLYFDLNKDLDLKNDAPIDPHKSPPNEGRLTYDNIKQQVLFQFLNLDLGAAGGMRSVQVMPRLTISTYEKEEYNQVSFVRTTLHEGSIKMGSQTYQAELGNDYMIDGRLDQPNTALKLSPGASMSWWGGDRLMAVHKVDGQFYTLSASPTGEEIAVHPYKGELGTFEIGSGGRDLSQMNVVGSLMAKDLAVAVGEWMDNGSSKSVQKCELPAGNYLPNYITVQLGKLRIAVSQNYHSDGKPRDRSDHQTVYGIQIRKDKAFVLDFSNKPDVLFASPSQNVKLKRGDSLEVKAVLVDPKLDIMIRGLDDTTRKQTKGPDGQPLGYEKNFSLDPAVLITRMNGEKVSEGVMPFG